MANAKKVFHHDDPPCTVRLDPRGDCPECKVHPDMQSKCVWYYCPRCDCPLKKMRCPTCKEVFAIPRR